MTNGSRNERWLAAKMTGPSCGNVLAADPAQPEVDVEERLQDPADQPVDERVDTPMARAVQEGLVIHVLDTRRPPRALQAGYGCGMALDQAKTARGALAGAVAAGVWAAQNPLDKRLFGVDYDDTELLGKAITRGPAWPVVGTALHMLNGAVFGAVYANVAPRTPLPSWARGPAAGLAEHVAFWPLTIVIDRFHPARGDLPRLATNPRAFGQAAWRHLLFGTCSASSSAA